MATILTIVIPALLGVVIGLLWRRRQWKRFYREQAKVETTMSVRREPEKLPVISSAPGFVLMEHD